MLLSRRNFYLIITLSFLCILTFGTAHEITPEDLEHDLQELEYLPSSSNNDKWNPEADKMICLAVMRKFCGRTESPLPTALDCVHQAIITWREDIIPDGILKNYYLSFTQHPKNLMSLGRFIMSPSYYCNTKRNIDVEKCEADLVNFKGTTKEAVKYALYLTTLDEYCTIAKVGEDRIVQPTNQFAFDYMLYMRRMILVHNNPYTIPEPEEYCHTTCYNRLNEESPLDWTPYYHESVEDN